MLRPLAIAVGFLTRVPVGRSMDERDLGASLVWFPAVGAALGAVLVGIAWLFHDRVPVELVALALVSVLAGLTGGLHLDGVADVFDALGGGRGDRARMLAIMRDSRIGAHGAAALVLLLLAKVFAVAQVLRHQDGWSLFAWPIVARWAVVPLVVCFPYARPEGLGKAFNGHGRLRHFAGATCVAALAIGSLGLHVLLAAAAAFVAALCTGLWLHRRIGGLTGDVYGTAIEIAELAFLIVAGLA